MKPEGSFDVHSIGFADGSAPDQIREQLRRILASDPFKNSQRYRAFLQHVVERTVEGRSERIKERSLGIDVFGRRADYDTAADPVVRITAGEVRKRLAQYYSSGGHEDELRISLPSGSYVAEFSFIGRGLSEFISVAPQVDGGQQEAAGLPNELGHRSPTWRLLGWPGRMGALLLILVAAIGFAAGRYWPRMNPPQRAAIDAFWDPVSSSSNVVVSIGEMDAIYDANQQLVAGTGLNLEAAPTVYDLVHRNTISWADSITASKITGFVQAKGSSFHILRSERTSLQDLRAAPTILIGGFNNKWIMRLMPQLRYRYELDRDHITLQIKDVRNLERSDWRVNVSEAPAQFTRDYGIIARLWDATAERPIIIVSGIAAYGTIAAGELLTTPKYMEMLAQQAPRDWKRKNFEAVFVTKIIDGQTGPPRVIASFSW